VFRITPCDPRVAVDTKRGGKTGGAITTQHDFGIGSRVGS